MLFYFVGAGAAVWVIVCGKKNGVAAGRDVTVWTVIAICMTILAINKQLDLQSLCTDIGRALSKTQGWYEQRRVVQKWFVVVFGISGSVLFLLVALVFRRCMRHYLLLWTGSALLGIFLVIRAASFHHFDALINCAPYGVRLNWVFELSGICLITAAACRDVTAHRKMM